MGGTRDWGLEKDARRIVVVFGQFNVLKYNGCDDEQKGDD